MGNDISTKSPENDENKKQKPVYAEFIASAGKTIGQASGVVCGSLSDALEEDDSIDMTSQTRRKKFHNHTFKDPEDDASLQSNPMSQLFARALLSEVIDNPSTMTPMQMAEREKKLLKAQQRANHASKEGLRAIGGQGTFKQHIQGASQRIIPPSVLAEHRAQVLGNGESSDAPRGKHSVTIGLMLSRRDPVVGHPDTVTRQSAYDFNDLQDRNYKYVSSTDSNGWRAGGGESGEPIMASDNNNISTSLSEDEFEKFSPSKLKLTQASKIPAPDNVHIPIIHIDCDSEAAVNAVVAALARGEVFIPHMSIMPEALGVNGISPPDLVVRFGCERNDDFPPEEWPNWCLEFMHNQLYEYFSDMGACWMKRPFQITLAKKVRWKTVKHMNKFFAHSETVINSWREMGPQYLDPQLTHIDGGATPEEVARPHGIYLLRNGKPTNYFAPNFEPPYTTKMTRSLLFNVISKSWDKKRRDWSTGPVSNVTPSLLFSTICGCAEPNEGGFVAREVTNHFSPIGGGGTFFGDHKYEHDLSFSINAKDDRSLIEGMKITREDSGITRSQIDIGKNKKHDTFQSKNLNNSSASSDTSKPATTFGSDNSVDQQTPLSQTRPNIVADDSAALEKSKDDAILQNLMMPSTLPDVNYATPFAKHTDNFAQYETPLINNRVGHNEQNLPQSGRLRDTYSTKSSHEPLPTGFRDEMPVQSNVHHREGTLNHSAAISVGESQTTVPIMNRSSAFIESERERRKQRELEREKERKKIDELEMAIQEKLRLQEDRKRQVTSVAISPVPETDDVSEVKVSCMAKHAFSFELLRSRHLPHLSHLFFQRKSKKEKKDKKEKKKREKKDRREKERSRSSSVQSRSTSNSGEKWDQSTMLGLHQDRPMPYSSFKENRENRKLDSDPVDSNSPNATHDSSYFPLNLQSTSSQKWNQNIFTPQSPSLGNNMEIHSAPSMDYSMDTASFLGDGSLIGGQFAGDSSVFTMGTSASDNKSLLSCVTRSTVHDMSGGRKKKGFPLSHHNAEDDTSQSLIASTSNGGGSTEPIPSDDDLFAIGWAKALDPKSGCYYYFTLDRSKTVWENPLMTQDI
jgi:hypothetical protein